MSDLIFDDCFTASLSKSDILSNVIVSLFSGINVVNKLLHCVPKYKSIVASVCDFLVSGLEKEKIFIAQNVIACAKKRNFILTLKLNFN